MLPLDRLKLPGGGELPPVPHGQRKPVSRTESSIADLPGWADELATILAYAVVFYGITAGLHAVNIKGGFIVAAALLGVLWMLRSFLVEPVAGLIKQIIMLGFSVLVELLDFLRQWYEGVLHYFQGNLVRAITRVLLVAAFLWIWELAQTIPAFREVLDTIAEATGRLIRWINDQVEAVLRYIRDLRDEVSGRAAELLERIGLANTALRDELLGQVDSLFGILIRQVGRVRVQLIARLDIVHTLAHARITLLGQTIALTPKLVTQRLLATYDRTGGSQTTDVIAAWRSLAARYSPPGAEHMAPWEIVAEFRDELAARAGGFLPIAVEWAAEARADIRAVQAGTPPERDRWPDKIVAPADPDVPNLDVAGGEYDPTFHLPPPVPGEDGR